MRKYILVNFIMLVLFGFSYGQGPNISVFSPTNNAVSVSTHTQLKVVFDTDVKKGYGHVEIRQSEDGVIVETINVNSPNISVSNAVLTITPTTWLSSGTAYYVNIAPGAVENLEGEPFLGILNSYTWNFTTVCGPGPRSLGGATTNQTAVLNWEAVSEAVDYQLWVSDIGVISSTNGNNFYILNDLPSG